MLEMMGNLELGVGRRRGGFGESVMIRSQIGSLPSNPIFNDQLERILRLMPTSEWRAMLN